MMKLRLICFGLFFNCFIYHTYAQIPFVCNSIEGYDTKALTSATQWEVTTDYQCLAHLGLDCTFFISFCQAAPRCFNEYSACQNSTGASNVTIIGGFTTTLFHENESGPKGFYAKFPKVLPQNISNTTYCEPSLKIQFNCNLKEQWIVPTTDATAFAPQPTDIDIDPNDPCLTIMTFDYPGACLNGEEPKESLHGGAIFLIILFSLIFVYLVIGTSYNKFVQHRSGINLLPQAGFWIGLPLNAIEGCRATMSCCSGSTPQSRATYESV